MSQTLLFVVGVGVFAITVCGALLYGYYVFNRSYQTQAAEGGAYGFVDVTRPSNVIVPGAAASDLVGVKAVPRTTRD